MKHYLIPLCFIILLTSCYEETKYTREQCIVRINIDWSNTQLNNKEYMIEEITDTIRKAPNMGFNKIPASSAIQGNDREFIYYQYKYDCENRIENTEKLLRYVQENVANLPPMEVDSRNFKPSVGTIRSSGPWWKN